MKQLGTQFLNMLPKFIGNHLTICIVFTFIQLTCPKMFDIQTPPLQKQQHYAPKSKQWKALKCVSSLSTWLEKQGKRLHKCSCTTQTKCKHVHRAKMIRSCARKVALPPQSRLNLVRLVVQVTLVMQAKGCQGVCDNATPFDTDSN